MADTTYTDRYGNEVALDVLMKNKNPEEQVAIKYFNAIGDGGCFGKKYVTDQAYLNLVIKQVGSLEDRQAQALNKLGLDVDQVQEIPPVGFQGYAFLTDSIKDMKHDKVRFTAGDQFVTATKELTWLFFGDEQIFVYKARIDMIDHAIRSENTLEYFYKDITAFSTESNSAKQKVPVLTEGCGQSKVETIDRVVAVERFKIVVPGEVFVCAISPEDDNASKISAMKQKLRDKKNT
jgi:hypothetical protein